MLQKLFLLTLALAILLSACSPAEKTATQPAPTDNAAYPAPAANNVQNNAAPTANPYPGSELAVPEATPFTIPAAGSETGVVIGQLIDQQTNQPLAGQTVYLGIIVPFNPDSYTYALQENTSPHTQADVEGRFAIGNVPPGEYIVLVWTPFNAVAVMDATTSKELLVNVLAGQTLDLGKLQASSPLSAPVK